MPRRIHLERHRTERIGWLRAAVPRRQRRHRLHGQSHRWRGGSECRAHRNAARRRRGTSGRCHVDGGGRVRVRQLAGRYRAGRRGTRASRAVHTARVRERELADIYVARGLTRDLATQVAVQLMAHDALGAHSRDELGVSDVVSARPVQAGLTSAATFAVGAALPLITSLVAPAPYVVAVVSGTSLVFLTALGALSASTGGAPVFRASARVAFWGALAMALTAVAGRLVGTVV